MILLKILLFLPRAVYGLYNFVCNETVEALVVFVDSVFLRLVIGAVVIIGLPLGGVALLLTILNNLLK